MTVDSKSKEGITIGLIDSIITIATILHKDKDLPDHPNKEVREAVRDLRENDEVSWLLTGQTSKEWEKNRELISRVVDGIRGNKIKIEL